MTALRAALRSEYRKLITTRAWWLLLLCMVGYMAFMAATLAFAMTQSTTSGTGTSDMPFTDSPATAIAVYTVAVSMGYVFPVIVGALSVTGEFRHRTITPTLLMDPNRTRVLAAKALASVPIGMVYGIVGVLAGLAAGAGTLALLGEATYLGDPAVQEAIGRSVLALMMWAVVGVGLGAAMTNQVVIIVVVLAFTQFVEPLLRTLLAGLSDGAYSDIAAYLPGAAGEAVSGSSIYSQMGLNLLSWWQGLLVLGAYAVVFLFIGRVTTWRRDIT